VNSNLSNLAARSLRTKKNIALRYELKIILFAKHFRYKQLKHMRHFQSVNKSF